MSPSFLGNFTCVGYDSEFEDSSLAAPERSAIEIIRPIVGPLAPAHPEERKMYDAPLEYQRRTDYARSFKAIVVAQADRGEYVFLTISGNVPQPP
jgi:hypothetical protein